jgi:hypothetical protein
MNRRHMTDDHHGRTAGRATLQVRAVDEILGTDRPGLGGSIRPRQGIVSVAAERLFASTTKQYVRADAMKLDGRRTRSRAAPQGPGR